MVEQSTEQLTVTVDGVQQAFEFQLFRKPLSLADLRFFQFWVDRAAVYGRRGGATHRSMVEFYWAICRQHGTASERDQLEKYVLARMYPLTRSIGSRRIVADGILSRPSESRVQRRDVVRQLDSELSGFSGRKVDPLQFRDQSAMAIGPNLFGAEAQQRYLQFIDEVFCDVASAPFDDASYDRVAERWQDKMRNYGRHRGNAAKKQLLDVISYESRTAIHCCYSTVWCYLLPELARQYQFSAEAFRFHQFWHLAPCIESRESEEPFRLFHGHIFALHPAFGSFLDTRTGTNLMAAWLKNPQADDNYQQLLHGLLTAVAHYGSARISITDDRQSRHEMLGDPDQILDGSPPSDE